jgi:hypothetical protein
MLTVITGKVPETFDFEKSENDAARLDRWADVLISQGYPRQGERLAVIAAELREGTQ